METLKYAKVTNNIVSDIVHEETDGYIPIDKNVFCGFVKGTDGLFYPPKPTEELSLMLLRIERNRRLQETDWMAVQDRVMLDSEKEYRQALRDITKKYKSLDDAVFPTLGEE